MVCSGGSRPSDNGGMGGPGHPDPEIRWVPGLQKEFFQASFWSENKRGGGGSVPHILIHR